ncbi:MAG: GntR family transcriptional regulator [Gemmatimonadaceae bacterium]
MNTKWNDEQPIYRQLRDRVVAMILEHAIAEGDALPSARSVAAEYKINHITVLKAYEELSGEGLVENRRGVGLFVTVGARERLLRTERKHFLQEEWPRIRARMHRLGLSAEELLREKVTASGARARGR